MSCAAVIMLRLTHGCQCKLLKTHKQAQWPCPRPRVAAALSKNPAKRPATLFWRSKGAKDEILMSTTTLSDAPNPAAVQPLGSGLEVISIAKSYDKRSVLSDISLTVAKGEVLGLLGPNGAGKTTCFYSIMGLVKPDSGRILMDGEDVTKLPMYRRAILGLGYLPQETSIFRGMTVEQNIACVLELVEPDKATRASELERLLEEFGLTRLRESPAMALSGGERRRCEIARALAAKPSIMLLDEPFAGIDPLSISDIRELVRDLKARGIGVLITDHNVRETLDIVDRACIIYGGQVLFAGSPQELVADENVRRLYLGESFTL
jgi:lipopolysaccharide export system ATP-binding protein